METKNLSRDEVIKNLLDKLLIQKAEVSKAERPVYITGGQFRYSESIGNTIDIMTVRDSRKLVEILAFLKDREKSFNEAKEELGVNVDFTWLGVSVEDWTRDLKTRLSVLNITAKRKELADLEERLNRVVPAELRTQMEVEAVQAALGV